MRRRYHDPNIKIGGGLDISTTSNGIYILAMDNKLYTRDMWRRNWNNDSVGVAVLTNRCKFVISKKYCYYNGFYGGYGIRIPGIFMNSDDYTHISMGYYNGKENTDTLINYLGSSDDLAASITRSTVYPPFPDGRIGYLGTLAEWAQAHQNRDEVDLCLSTIEGDNLLTYFWTSSQSTAEESFIYYWEAPTDRGISAKKSKEHKVRALASLI